MPTDPAAGQAVPLLTIAIPTYNRSGYLKELLDALYPQVAAFPQVEVLLCDNASPDATAALTAAEQARFVAAGAQLRVHRHPTNIGSDANFASCFRLARGRFFWMCGDDDIIDDGALAQIVPLLENTPDLDMVYATSYGFRDGQDYRQVRAGDPFGRTVQSYTDALPFARVVNVMFTFISALIVNRERLLTVMREPPEAFLSTNLVQLSWALPLLNVHRRSFVLWTRPVAGRQGNANGYSLGRVFGEKLKGNIERLLPGRKDLQGAIMNPTLRRWFPSMLLDVRSSGNTTMNLEEAHAVLARTFGRNPRYWFFTWPVLKLPLPAAKLYAKLCIALSKLIYMVHLPGFWRRTT